MKKIYPSILNNKISSLFIIKLGDFRIIAQIFQNIFQQEASHSAQFVTVQLVLIDNFPQKTPADLEHLTNLIGR
jgi:hypothetical protein